MIIDFQPYLDRRRAKENLAGPTRGEFAVGARGAEVLKRPFSWTPFDESPLGYQASFKELWQRVHAAIQKNDIYAIETERRLGQISNLALYLVDSWPANLKGFLYRRHGDGCITQDSLNVLLPLIDKTASQARLKPIDQVKSEQSIPAQ